MTLVLCEKKLIADSILQVLGGGGKAVGGAYEKGDYIITWLYGHILELKEPEDYDPKYAKRCLEDLPIFFPNWDVKPAKDTANTKGMTKAQRLKNIRAWLRQCDTVIHAGDPDDEGQLIVDEVLRYCAYKGKVLRLDTANTSKPGMTRAMANLTDNKPKECAGWAAYARSVADMMVGVNLSRLFSLKNETFMTIGRVQTPTLYLVYLRDMQIEGHNKLVYYTVAADTLISGQPVRATLSYAKDDPALVDGKLLDKALAEKKAAALKGRTFQNAVISKKQVTESPPLPFNLSKLQVYCSSHFGYSPEQVMKITQSLRDNYGSLITYNRTDCRYLPTDYYRSAPVVMDTVVQNIRFRPKDMDMSIKSKAFDDSKITVHFAIIPTEVRYDVRQLPEDERNVYLAIVKYFMAQFMPPAKKEITTLTVPLENGESLTARSTKVLAPGYLSIFKDADQDLASVLSDIAAGTYGGSVANTEVQEKETKPPARFTPATLVNEMSSIAKYVTDPAIKKLLLDKDKDAPEEHGSIGTPATRTQIINNLLKRGFIAYTGKGEQIASTPLGREMMRILPESLKRPDMTALWWEMQQEIITGVLGCNEMIESVLRSIQEVIAMEHPKVNKSILPNNGSGSVRESLGKCPRCGKDVIEGKLGYGCTGWRDSPPCNFTIWKEAKAGPLAGKKLTPTQAKRLLACGEVGMKGLKSKKGSTYDAVVVMKPNEVCNGKLVVGWELRFDDSPPRKPRRNKT